MSCFLPWPQLDTHDAAFSLSLTWNFSDVVKHGKILFCSVWVLSPPCLLFTTNQVIGVNHLMEIAARSPMGREIVDFSQSPPSSWPCESDQCVVASPRRSSARSPSSSSTSPPSWISSSVSSPGHCSISYSKSIALRPAS